MKPPPQMNTRLILEAPMRVQDGIGGHSLAWTALGTIWAEMRASAGRESRGETGAVSTVGWSIVTRAAAAGATSTATPRIISGRRSVPLVLESVLVLACAMAR